MNKLKQEFVSVTRLRVIFIEWKTTAENPCWNSPIETTESKGCTFEMKTQPYL